MKAWLVKEKDEFCATVVFAETRGKAKYLARLTAACEDVPYTRIEAIRVPSVDKYYKEGMTELDWRDPKDRLIMVKECGFTCDYDSFFAGLEDCCDCSALGKMGRSVKTMPVEITECQYQELLDVMTEIRPADVVRTFENITGIVVKPYTGYQFFDVADNYLGDYGSDTIMQILNNAGIEVVHE